jgi:hypothetical protein
LIKNAIHNHPRQTGRLTRWNPEGNPLERWSATALLWVETGFRKIQGHEAIAPNPAALVASPTKQETRNDTVEAK